MEFFLEAMVLKVLTIKWTMITRENNFSLTSEGKPIFFLALILKQVKGKELKVQHLHQLF